MDDNAHVPVSQTRVENFRPFGRLEQRDLQVVVHSHFGAMWAPETLNEFSLVVEDLGWQSGGWRGQADLEWRLDSAAVRRLRVPRPEGEPLQVPPEYLEHHLREYENRLLQRARMAGHGHRDGRELSDLELFAVLQHHGAATRLLDCTRNAYTALWFAAIEHPDSHGLVIGLDPADSFAVHQANTLRRPMTDLLDEAGARLSFWRPSALSPRIPANRPSSCGVRPVTGRGGRSAANRYPTTRTQPPGRFRDSSASRYRPA